MKIPKDIIKSINNGLDCPICKNGFIKIATARRYYYDYLYCDSCGKSVTIYYKEEPFEIVNIEENK